jgi:hypothetical protein
MEHLLDDNISESDETRAEMNHLLHDELRVRTGELQLVGDMS